MECAHRIVGRSAEYKLQFKPFKPEQTVELMTGYMTKYAGKPGFIGWSFNVPKPEVEASHLQ